MSTSSLVETLLQHKNEEVVLLLHDNIAHCYVLWELHSCPYCF